MNDAELDAIHAFVWQLGTHWFEHELYYPLDQYGGISLGAHQEWMAVQLFMLGLMKAERHA